LSGVWRFEFSRSFPRRWTRLGVLEHSRIFPRRKLDTSSFSVGRLGNFFIRGPRSLLISDFLAEVAHGVAGPATLLPPLKAQWTSCPQIAQDSATFVWTTPTADVQPRRLGNVFTRGPRSLLISDFLAKVAHRVAGLATLLPPLKAQGTSGRQILRTRQRLFGRRRPPFVQPWTRKFFHTSSSVPSDFRFFGQSCSGVAGPATLLPPLKPGDIWSTNLPDSAIWTIDTCAAVAVKALAFFVKRRWSNMAR
jgi:hypothetical protein